MTKIDCLMAIDEIAEGIPSYANGIPPGRGALRTGRGIYVLNAIGRRLHDYIEREVCEVMKTMSKASALDALELIGMIEDNVHLTDVANAYFCAAIKIAALRKIALPHALPIELEGIAV